MAWLGLGYSALLSIVYCYFIWAHALNRIGVAHTAVFSNVTPIVALAAGWALLGERPLAAQLIGGVVSEYRNLRGAKSERLAVLQPQFHHGLRHFQDIRQRFFAGFAPGCRSFASNSRTYARQTS